MKTKITTIETVGCRGCRCDECTPRAGDAVICTAKPGLRKPGIKNTFLLKEVLKVSAYWTFSSSYSNPPPLLSSSRGELSGGARRSRGPTLKPAQGKGKEVISILYISHFSSPQVGLTSTRASRSVTFRA